MLPYGGGPEGTLITTKDELRGGIHADDIEILLKGILEWLGLFSFESSVSMVSNLPKLSGLDYHKYWY